jgi:hypothetical protein
MEGKFAKRGRELAARLEEAWVHQDGSSTFSVGSRQVEVAGGEVEHGDEVLG